MHLSTLRFGTSAHSALADCMLVAVLLSFWQTAVVAAPHPEAYAFANASPAARAGPRAAAEYGLSMGHPLCPYEQCCTGKSPGCGACSACICTCN